MKNFILRLSLAVGIALSAVMGLTGVAYAQTVTTNGGTVDQDAVNLSHNAGAALKVTAIAVIGALIAFAVAILLARRALPWAKRLLGI